MIEARVSIGSRAMMTRLPVMVCFKFPAITANTAAPPGVLENERYRGESKSRWVLLPGLWTVLREGSALPFMRVGSIAGGRKQLVYPG